MGWSASSRACKVLDRISEVCFEDFGSQNTWKKDGREFFYEIGRENSDGSITGKVVEVQNGYALNRGSLKITGDGKLVRFPHMTKRMRWHALEESRVQQEFAKGAMFVVT